MISNTSLDICPDLDTVTYTLAGLATPGTGWGIEGDTFNCLEPSNDLGNPTCSTWVIETGNHIMRTHLLKQGQATDRGTQQFQPPGGRHAVAAMCDTPLHTLVLYRPGEMEFQTYFVREAFQPVVQGFRWTGVEEGKPTRKSWRYRIAGLVIFCPSNPFVSIIQS